VYDQAALVRDGVSSVRDAMLVGPGSPCWCCCLFLRQSGDHGISAAAIPLTLAITVFVMRSHRPDVQPDDAGREWRSRSVS